MPAVEKNATNPHFGSRFVSLDHLIARTKPVLTKHGLAIVQFPATTDQGAPALTTTLIHGESGEQLSGTVPLVLAKQDMQGLGAALTYARRYGWASALAISDEDDDDGNSASASGTGATQASSSAGTVGGAADSGEVTAQPPTSAPLSPPNLISGDGGDWVWPFGKHKGVALKDTPIDYVQWYAEQGTKDDVKQRCSVFLTPGDGGGFVDDPDSGIPF